MKLQPGPTAGRHHLILIGVGSRMKVCPKCGQATNDDSDEFCTKCGAYFTDGRAQVQQSSPVAAAMGMAAPHVRDQAVPVPEGGTLRAGLDDMAAGNFPEAVAQWTSWVRESGEPSEEDYRSMVVSACDCIMSTVGEGKAHSRAGVAELAMELDGDLLQDLSAELMSRLDGLSRMVQAGDLATECMYLAMESFSVYPDLRDVLEVMESVPQDMAAISAAAEGMEPDDGRAARLTETYTDYARMMGDAMRVQIEKAGDERMDRLADYWSSKPNLPYANIAYQIASLHTQIAAAKNVGRLTGKLLKKGLDMQIDGFNKSYFGPKVRSEEVRELALLDLVVVEHGVH